MGRCAERGAGLGAVGSGHERSMTAARPVEARAHRAVMTIKPYSRDVNLLLRRALAEFIGTALLLIAVIGSGIAATSLSPGDVGLELLENAVATGAALVAIILAVGSVSGAHLNPVVSAADAVFGGLRPRELATYVIAQMTGAVAGAIIANVMFSLPAVSASSHVRSTPGLW